MSRLSTLALYLTLCTKLVTSQTAEETACAENPAIYVQECVDACNQNQFNNQACCEAGGPFNTDACSQECLDNPNNHRACCAAGDPYGNGDLYSFDGACFAACDEARDNHQACCAAGDPYGNGDLYSFDGACFKACNENPGNNRQACCASGDSGACSEACAANHNNHQACCAAGDQSACCDADDVDDTVKKMGCCLKALTDDDPATVCLATPIDSAELKKQQNSASC
jgi:hypothetical protein